MVKMMFCLRRRPELSATEFQDRWRNAHGPLVARHARALGIERYVQTETLVSPLNGTLAGPRHAPPPFDGVAELWWPDERAIEASVAAREGRIAARALLEDEARFIDLANSPIWIAREHVIVAR